MTVSKNLTFRFCRLGDIETINAFYNDANERPGAGRRGVSPRSRVQWLWEFGGGLDEEEPPYCLAFEGGRLVGTQAFIPIKLVKNGQVHLSEKSEDTLVAPEHRGQGVLDEMYRRLLERAEKRGVTVQWGFTTSAVKPLLRSNFQSLGRVEVYRLNLTAGGVAGSLRRVLVKPERSGLAHINRWAMTIDALKSFVKGKRLRRGGHRREELRAVKSGKGEVGWDGFSEEFSRRESAATLHLGVEYLRWRCIENPYYRYSVIGHTSGKLVSGLAVVKYDVQTRMGFLSALAATAGTDAELEEILMGLIFIGVQRLAKAGCRSVTSWLLGHHPYTERLRRLYRQAGFMIEGLGDHFMVRTVGEGDKRWLDADRWVVMELMSEK